MDIESSVARGARAGREFYSRRQARGALLRFARFPYHGLMSASGPMSASAMSPPDGEPQRVTRFAPSPTGELHLGNARTALFNLLLARSAGGRFLLRIEDTDSERSLDSHTTALMADLRWLRIDRDAGPDRGDDGAPYRQAPPGPLDRRAVAGVHTAQ